jgi:1-deoxy-D-xylulose-5-phosphate synthase
VDGHNYDAVLDALRTSVEFDRPVVLHVRTLKGKGYEPAERDSRTFHGIGANVFEPSDGTKKSAPAGRPKFQDAFGDAMIALAEKDPRVVGITAAMPDGTGLAKFAKKFPDRYFDVGIAEAHAVCSAAGMATNGLRPICAIYSTFLQRAYDQIVHDVVVQNLPVVFCMDRSGFVGDDGPTHMGLYDIAYLRTLPNMTVMAPRCEAELLPMMEHAISLNAPAAIRYPRGSTSGRHDEAVAPIVQGKAEVLRRGSGVAVLGYGNTVDVALDAYDLFEGDRKPTIVNARFAKPLDERLLLDLPNDHTHIVTLEEHALPGGFGSAVSEFVTDRGLAIKVHRIGVPNVLVQHDSQDKQRAAIGLNAEALAKQIASLLGTPVTTASG